MQLYDIGTKPKTLQSHTFHALSKITLAALNQETLAFVTLCKQLFQFFVNTPFNMTYIVTNCKSANKNSSIISSFYSGQQVFSL
jgi:hypothetical protein